MQDEHQSSVDFWLSRLPYNHSQSFINGPPSPSPSAPSSLLSLSHQPSSYSPMTTIASSYSPFTTRVKRKRSVDDQIPPHKRLRPGQPLTRQALRSITGNMGGASKPNHVQAQDPSEGTSSSIIPETPTKSTTSSDLRVKQAKNIANIRSSLAANGMWFDKTERLDACVEFKEKVYAIFEKNRPSRMDEESFKKMSQFMKKHATDNEATYFEGLVNPVIKSERTVATKKRDATGEILFVCQSFEDDEMVRKKDVNFVKRLLPGTMDKKTENQLGLTDPKPDFTFGIQRNETPLPGTAPSDLVASIIGVADGMIHPFFVIENKGCEGPIDVARNQAIRDGACIVNARIHLHAMTEDQGWKRPAGADMDAIAFSCTWDVTISELWIHWHETLDDGAELFHMNRLGQYVTGRQTELTQFRHDIHNILDWGILTNRQKCEETVHKIMTKAKLKQQSGKGAASGSGKGKAGSAAGSKA